MIIEANPCENCDFTPSVCDGDIEICQLTKGNSRPISEKSFEKEQLEQYKRQYMNDHKKELTKVD